MARRSVMFTPGDRPEMVRKSPGSGADVVVFDLEDAVAPGRKEEARHTVHDILADPTFDPDCEVCVRVNPHGAGASADLDRVVGTGTDVRLDSVMAPKVRSADDVDALADILGEHGFEVPILALVESAAGVLAADEIAAASPTDALVFGAEDLAADVGATRTRDGTEVCYARQRVVLAAAARRIDAIDTLVTDFEDRERLREDARRSVQFGYDGKLAIHPEQVDPINEAFTPDPAEIAWAEEVHESARVAEAEDRGVFEVNGEMIDAPLVTRAERILQRAEAANVR